MSLTYDQLRVLIGLKAGYCPNLSVDDFEGNQAAIVQMALDRGLNRFLECEINVRMGEREKHQWSFLTPVPTYSIPAGASSIVLPENFVEFLGDPVYDPGQSGTCERIRLEGADRALERLSWSQGTGRPNIGGVRALDDQAFGKTIWELVFHPVANADYQVKAPTKINALIPNQTTALVIGGSAHENTAIEACRAELVAILDDLDDGGKAEGRFQQFLSASIAHDRSQTAARMLPRITDPSMYDWRKFCVEAWCSEEPLLLYQGRNDW